jgi:type I restriction enzyme R subunit
MAPPPTYIDLDEAKIRLEIDRKLEQAGWVVQEKKKLNLHESLGDK